MLQQLAITSGASQAEVLSDCWNFSDSFFFFPDYCWSKCKIFELEDYAHMDFPMCLFTSNRIVRRCFNSSDSSR